MGCAAVTGINHRLKGDGPEKADFWLNPEEQFKLYPAQRENHPCWWGIGSILQSIRISSFLAAGYVQTMVPRHELTFLLSFSHLTHEYCKKTSIKQTCFLAVHHPRVLLAPCHWKINFPQLKLKALKEGIGLNETHSKALTGWQGSCWNENCWPCEWVRPKGTGKCSVASLKRQEKKKEILGVYTPVSLILAEGWLKINKMVNV